MISRGSPRKSRANAWGVDSYPLESRMALDFEGHGAPLRAPVLSITQLNRLVADLIESRCPAVWVAGGSIIAHLGVAGAAMHAAWQMAASANATPAPGVSGDLILRVDSGKEPDGTPLAKIHVIDTGPGIAPETLEKIFNPYFTTRSGGSGLGLPTCRRLIEEHGGRIDVHSELGRGSDFTVVLPLEQAQPD